MIGATVTEMKDHIRFILGNFPRQIDDCLGGNSGFFFRPFRGKVGDKFLEFSKSVNPAVYLFGIKQSFLEDNMNQGVI